MFNGRKLLKSITAFIKGMKVVNIDKLVGDGRHSFVHGMINSNNFPDILMQKDMRIGENVSIIQFIGIDSVPKMLRMLERRGYRPANVHEVAGYCNINPRVQRIHSIVVLGSPIIPKNGDEKHSPVSVEIPTSQE